ncbi:CAAX farnesyltransferase (FTase) subunit beta [Thecaphora frezii]
MPTTTYPAWATPTDNVHSVTTDDQHDTEQDIHRLFAPHRHPVLNIAEPPADNSQPLVNPWLAPEPDAPSASNGNGNSSSSSKNGNSCKNGGTDHPAPLPTLNRQAHLNFLIKQIDPLPAPFVSFDTNRAWLLYWILHSYDLLSASLDPSGRARAITTLLSFQNRQTGGFGGGPNQLAHLMSTFAAVLALATIGGPGPAPSPADVEQGKSVEIGKGGWDDIDRAAMYRWMLSLKQPDGSFLVHENGEVDVRASYCVVSVAMLLGICTPQLVRGVGEFVASCQTYEGGLAAGSQPSYAYQPTEVGAVPYLADLGASRPQLGEAHGGYTFCALATHLALSRLPFCGEGPILPASLPLSVPAPAPARSHSQRTNSAGDLNVPLLLRWATSLQGLPIEGGGFRGRSNKLVDGCYGWFCGGGLFSVLTPVVQEYQQRQAPPAAKPEASLNGLDCLPALPTLHNAATDGSSDDSWQTEVSAYASDEVDTDLATLYDRVALQEYILVAAQAPKGGLRDKPGKRPDAYHTNYNLAGLSLAQHRVKPSAETRAALEAHWKGTTRGGGEAEEEEEEEEEWRKQCYLSGLSWTLDPKETVVVGEGDEGKRNNAVNPTHPIFTITFPKVKAIMDWAYGQM